MKKRCLFVEIYTLNKRKEELEHEVQAKDKYIKILEKQLLQQDNAIIRKDQDFKMLKRLYRDDLINNL